MTQRKLGRLTVEEQQYIHDNYYHRTYLDIAKHLNRDPHSIKKFIEKKFNQKVNVSEVGPKVRANHILKEKQFWPTLLEKFTAPELDAFVSKWEDISKQFDNDILPTEEMQIIDIITMDILSDRCLIDQKKAMEDANNIELQLEDEEDVEVMRQLQNQLIGYRQAIGALAKEYRDLINQKNKELEKVKGTRKDRIQRIDAKKESYISWLEELIRNPEVRKEKGRLMEKMRLSILDEEVRLAAYHKYADGKVDQPLLNSDTVKPDNT